MSLPRCVVALTRAELHDFLTPSLRDELHALFPHLVELELDGNFSASLAAAAPEVLLAGWSTPPLPETLPPSLRYVCYLAGSVKHLVTGRQLEGGLLVTNWGGSISRTVAEAALWHILTGLRRGTHWTLAMHCDRAWKRTAREETASLFGRSVGLHGFGRVARELVRLLETFGCRIAVFAPELDDATARMHGVIAAGSLASLFSENDIVVEVAPLTPATRGSVTADLLARLRPGSVFVNVGRGEIVDEAALIRVAQEGRVHFGLDVFTTEPLPADSPLRGLRNVSLTPHLAGPTTDRCSDAGAFALANLRAYVEGRPLQALITPAIYATST
jgi:phosphoglycerate dehydrogenase-like enzyme